MTMRAVILSVTICRDRGVRTHTKTRAAMRRSWAALLILALGCSKDASHSRVVQIRDASRLPVGLIDQWVVVTPAALKGDTLTLRSDSTATGIIPWPPPRDRMAKISRWKVQFGSKDPVGTRRDWKEGYSDGGDPECMLDNAPGCVSLPMICLGATRQYFCSAFRFVPPDSLALQSGLRYVRVRRHASVHAGAM
jgi:hypothetical protein